MPCCSMTSRRTSIHGRRNVARGEMLKKHVIAIGVVLVSAITCGATFLLALYRPFTPVEVAASLATAVQLYLLSSSIGDLLDDKEEQPAAAGGGGGDCRSAGVLLS